MIKSCYIHIPFCKTICSYCDFCKMFYNKEFVYNYLKALDKEIDSVYKGETMNTLYLGGGTPSALDMDELEILFKTIKKIKVGKDLEFSFEVNVDDITEEKLIFLKRNKVNRLSIGIQTVNQKYLKFLNRTHNKKHAKDNILLAKKYFDNISVDLMYGFNGQTIDELKDDLDFFISLGVQHISTYSLILEKNTVLYIKNIESIDEELESNMYYYIVNYLKENNYNHYEISNFSKKGFSSRHNLTYWNNEKYYGFGLGASGYISNVRYTNTRSLTNYIKGSYVYQKENITDILSMENEIIFGLRKISGINKDSFYKKYNRKIKDVFKIDVLLNTGLLKENDKFIYIPFDKLYVQNSILINFIGGQDE